MTDKPLFRGLIRHRLLTLIVVALATTSFLGIAGQIPTIDRVAGVYSRHGLDGVLDKLATREFPWTETRVELLSRSPEDYGIDASQLAELTQELADKNTQAFLVVKDEYIVHEWYGNDSGAEHKHFTAALAKAITGSLVLMAAVDDGHIALDDPASKYIPGWRSDPKKSRITIGQLGSHTSGLEDVEFQDNVSPEWKRTYYQNRDTRFPLAISTASVIIEPGTRYSYSGVGYYALAYALSRSLKGTAKPDLRDLLESRLMVPLGIPAGAWRISYGERYRLDEMKLYAIGSGGGFTPRAVARIGQFMLRKGEWNGRRLVGPQLIDTILAYGSRASDPTTTGAGWTTNVDGFFPSLPRDAFWGHGAGDQVLLVVPSLELVMVRMGDSLSEDGDQATTTEERLEQYLFSPLMESVR